MTKHDLSAAVRQHLDPDQLDELADLYAETDYGRSLAARIMGKSRKTLTTEQRKAKSDHMKRINRDRREAKERGE